MLEYSLFVATRYRGYLVVKKKKNSSLKFDGNNNFVFKKIEKKEKKNLSGVFVSFSYPLHLQISANLNLIGNNLIILF